MPFAPHSLADLCRSRLSFPSTLIISDAVLRVIYTLGSVSLFTRTLKGVIDTGFLGASRYHNYCLDTIWCRNSLLSYWALM